MVIKIIDERHRVYPVDMGLRLFSMKLRFKSKFYKAVLMAALYGADAKARKGLSKRRVKKYHKALFDGILL